MRATRALAVLCCSVTVIATLAFTGAAQADSDTDLGWNNFGSMVVDSARSQLILSSGGGGTEIKTTNLAGAVTATLTGFSGPTGMAINGSTLYVMESDSGDITPVDLSTNTVGAALTSGFTGNTTLTYGGGRLWTSAGGGLDRINPSTGVVTSFTSADFAVGGGPTLTTNPADSGQIAMLSTGGGTDDLRLFDVSTAPPTLIRSATVTSYGGDVRYSEDGTSLFTPSDVGANEYATSTLALTNTYAIGTSYGLDSTTVSGTTYLGGSGQSSGRIQVWPDGASSPTMNTTYPGTNMDIASPPPGGLTFSPTGNRLYVAAYRYATSTFQLSVIDGPTHPASQVMLTAPDEVTFGDPVHITGSLSYADAAAVGAGETIQVWQRVESDAPAMVGTTTTADGGAWSFDQPTDETEMNKTLTFWAAFPGNGTHRTSTSSTDQTFVGKIRPSVSLKVSSGSITVGNKVTLHVHLELDPTIDHTITIMAKYDGSGSGQAVAHFNVNSKGDGAVTLAPIHNVTYTAVSTADKHHDSERSNSKDVKVHAKVTGALGKYYAVKNGVHLYHAGVDPTYKVTVKPNANGSNVYVYVEKHTSSGWKLVAKGPFELPRGSSVLLYINHARLGAGVTYRIQGTFENGRNAFGESRWSLFKVA